MQFLEKHFEFTRVLKGFVHVYKMLLDGQKIEFLIVDVLLSSATNKIQTTVDND